jgi:ATP-binding cassette subfamily C protein CydD/ATP-binding cassette subfamily C protein CydCD
MRITDVLYNEKQAVFFLCLLQLFVSICTIGAAWQLSRVVCDVFLQNLSLNAAAPNIGLLLFFLLTRIILQYMLNNRLHSFASRLQLKIRKKLHRCLIMQAIPSDRLQLLAIETTDALDKISSSILPQLLSILVLMPLILILIFFTDLQSAVIVLVTLPIAPILLALIGHKTKSATLDQWRKLARLTASFRDMLAGIITIKIFIYST